MSTFRFSLAVPFVLLSLTLNGCASRFTPEQAAPEKEIQEKDPPKPDSSSDMPRPETDHLAMGNPSGATADTDKPNNYLVKKRQYALSYNNSAGTPNWVSWHLNKQWLGKARRGNAFAPDTTLPTGFFSVRPNDYRGAGFDRGHMCPSGDRSADKEDQDATFAMSNMVPQSPNLNRGTWEKLEEYCRSQARDGKELFIVAGPSGRGGFGENGYKTYLRAHGGKVLVPGKCWKVVLFLPEGVTDPKKVTAEARMIAVIMPNIQGLDTAWRSYAVSVKDVEDLTGFTFFSNLPADVAKELKATNKETRAKPVTKEGDKKEPDKGIAKKGEKDLAGELSEFKQGCVIGNRKSKKYHVAGSSYYAKAKDSKNAIFFASVEAAQTAGYTPAGGKASGKKD